MKPFNLEEARKGKPVCTRDGRDVEILKFDVDSRYPVLGLVQNKELILYSTTGSYMYSENNRYDLFMKTEKKEGWVIVYKYKGKIICSNTPYKSKSEANKAVDETCSFEYLATVKIEWEE